MGHVRPLPRTHSPEEESFAQVPDRGARRRAFNRRGICRRGPGSQHRSRRDRDRLAGQGGHEEEAQELDAQAVRQEQPDRRDGRHDHRQLLGKNVKLDGKGFKYCTANTLNGKGQTACPAGSKAGSGTAHAVVGPGHAPVGFTVDAYVGSKNSIIFYTQQVGGTVRKGLVGKVSKASGKFGSKIVITIDPDLQQPATNVYSSLVDLKTTIKAKKGKHFLVSSTGCPSDKKHRFGVKFHFNPNSTFPATGSSVTGPADSPCSK